MKYSAAKRAAIVAAVAAVAGVGACNNDLTSVNSNPNSPTSAPPGTIFTRAAQIGAQRWLGTNYNLRGAEYVVQHLAEVQYPQNDNYTRLTASGTSSFFDQAYYQELEDLAQVVRTGRGANSPGIFGPAMALQVWGFNYLTDTYGDVPYFQALKGDSTAPQVSPAYDAQKDIYTDLFRVLDTVATTMAAPPSGNQSLGTADPIYAGNALRWQRFANSLRARLAMRLANVDPATAKAQFVAASNAPGGFMASTADNAQITWPGDGIYDNPWSTNFQSRDDQRISDRLLTVMQATNDPRVTVYAQKAAKDTTNDKIVKWCYGGTTPCYVGLLNALSQGDASAQVAYTSRPGLRFYPARTTYGVSGGGSGPTQPSYLLTFAEVSLLKAEAAERGWISGSAAQFYQDGIRASMTQWGVSDANTTAYLASPSVAYQGGTAGLKQIAVQKYVALFTDGGQAWAEWRRTCQPSNLRTGPTAIVNQIPRRFFYSLNDQVTNGANLGAAISHQGADNFLTRVYWDKSPAAAPTCGS